MDPEGKIKSSKDIERKLEADGILDQFVENSSEVASKVSSTSKDCVEDSDEDYKPPLKKKQLLKVMSNLGGYFLWSLEVMFRFPLHKIQKFEVIF